MRGEKMTTLTFYKCDRCGKEFSLPCGQHPTRIVIDEPKETVSGVDFVAVTDSYTDSTHGNTFAVSRPHLDLCEECAKKHQDFIKNP